MKSTILLAMFCLLWLNTVAQAPQAFKYQAVARNSAGEILTNQKVSFRISVQQRIVNGVVVYAEQHSVTTNGFGLANLDIGKGTPSYGVFSGIKWSTDEFYLRVEMDPSGGSSYQDMGITQLLSVPYALHAKNVELEADGDASNELQKISISGTVLTLDKNGGSVTLPSGGTSGDNWGIQTVVTDVTLTGNGTTATPLRIAQQAATSGQVLKWNGAAWLPANDETGTGSSPFVSSGGITRNTNLTDHFVFGSSSLDGLAVSGENKKMFFNKIKGAFRAGESYTTSWDDANVGSNSTAFGEGPVASGLVSFASGRFTLASGIYSTAFGAGTYAIGMASTAMGGSTKATGDESTAMGYNTVAAAKSSVAMGRYNAGAGSGSSWVETDPVLEIGIGSSDTEKLNAVTVLKNGKVGIGTATPTEKLEVAGKVKITGGSPGSGKVLTSDASGLASWQNPVNGLNLPAHFEVASDGYVFSISNNSEAAQVPKIAIIGSSNSGTGIIGQHASETSSGIGVFGSTRSNVGYSGYFTGGKFYVSSKTGIGTDSPLALLHTNGTGTGEGNVVFTGTMKSTDPGNPPVSGAGTRMMWYPDKAAFRAGVVEGDSWNQSLVGYASFATGVNTVASGSNSVAMGVSTTASGFYSTALGMTTIASSTGTTAMGLSTKASGSGAVSMGYATTASGGSSLAMGTSSIASGDYSFATGSQTQSKGGSSMAAGRGTIATAFSSAAFGRNNVGGGSTYTWEVNDPLFEIGIGSSETVRANALTVLKNGNVGIGIANPSARLDVNGQVKITGGSPGTGKVLTSDASGLASWQNPSGGFTLPYIGTASSADNVLEIRNSGPGNGIMGYSIAGTAVGGLATAANSANIGVAGGSFSSSGVGVWGNNTSLSAGGIGVRGSVYHSGGYSGYFTDGKFYVSGNVGIGTQNPVNALSVTGQASISDKLVVGGTAMNGRLFVAAADGSGNGLKIGSTAGDDASIYFMTEGLIFDNYRASDARRQPVLLQPNGGRVGIGTKFPTQVLHVVGNAYKTEGGTLWSTSSDLRLKTVMGDYEKGLNELIALQPVRFRYLKDNPRGLSSDIEQVGFVAQDVRKIFPESVTEAEDGYLDFNMHEINVALVNAVKELKAENNLLKERLENLEQFVRVSAQK